MSRLRLSSASFSELVNPAPRKSPSNPYILATAVPSFGGFDKAEAGKYRKGLFRFKKKDKPFARRNTLSSCSVLTEFLEEKDRSGKSGKGRSVDDTEVLKTVTATTLPRSGGAFRRQSSAIEGEGRVGYTKNNVSIKHRYAFSKVGGR